MHFNNLCHKYYSVIFWRERRQILPLFRCWLYCSIFCLSYCSQPFTYDGWRHSRTNFIQYHRRKIKTLFPNCLLTHHDNITNQLFFCIFLSRLNQTNFTRFFFFYNLSIRKIIFRMETSKVYIFLASLLIFCIANGMYKSNMCHCDSLMGVAIQLCFQTNSLKKKRLNLCFHPFISIFRIQFSIGDSMLSMFNANRCQRCGQLWCI